MNQDQTEVGMGNQHWQKKKKKKTLDAQTWNFLTRNTGDGAMPMMMAQTLRRKGWAN
jgi:hypothetical protein